MTTTPSHPLLWAEFVKAVQQEVVPALGCTEPISLALASAIATHHLGDVPEKIDAKVSANLMKNGMGVTVPGTGMLGLHIAAAVGALGGDPNGRLEVLKKLTPSQVANAKAMLDKQLVKLSIAAVPNILYSEATVYHQDHWVRVCIADAHTNVILIENESGIVFQATPNTNGQSSEAYNIDCATAKDVFDFATQAPLEMIEFIADAAKLNSALSDEGLNHEYGLKIGATLKSQLSSGLMSDDLLSRILVRTTAASDARMGGATLPAMSNSGSGNQGIAATMPVVVVADFVNASEETLARALMLSHLMAIYIHTKLPKLSALCAVTTASMGAAAGIAYLLTGQFETVSMAISSMIGDVAGMICDGASNSCAMKVSTSASAAFKAVLMAKAGIRVTGQEGIVAQDIDQSIENLGRLACKGMAETDTQILHIMLNKQSASA